MFDLVHLRGRRGCDKWCLVGSDEKLTREANFYDELTVVGIDVNRSQAPNSAFRGLR